MSWTPKEAQNIMALKGRMSAVAVGQMYGCGAETIRRLWRGETYVKSLGGGKEARLKPTFNAPAIPEDIQAESDALLEELFKQQAAGPKESE